MRKRFYILFVSRDAEGQLRKISIPVHYLYVFLTGALIGMFSLTGIAGSYSRMMLKVARFNELHSEKEALKTRYSQLEEVTREKEIEVASLGSLAGEVSALYGLKSSPVLTADKDEEFKGEQLASSIDQLYLLRRTALTGAATLGIGMGPLRNATAADWLRLSAAPTIWPVEGPVSGSFGERVDPFNGEGAFHSGIDISSFYGQKVVAPADGVILFADRMGGYGRMVIIEHGNGISTRFGHLAAFAVVAGQSVRRGETIGSVGLSGRSTGPHLHYEVRIFNTPVNPHKYLRTTLANAGGFAAGS